MTPHRTEHSIRIRTKHRDFQLSVALSRLKSLDKVTEPVNLNARTDRPAEPSASRAYAFLFPNPRIPKFMANLRDGMNFAPTAAKPEPVVAPEEFAFAAVHFDHGHLYGQVNGLTEAGAWLKWIYDHDDACLTELAKKYPQARVAASLSQILDDPDVKLVAAAAVPSERQALGLQVLRAGKDYFTDKSPFTTLDQLDEARLVVEETGRKYACYFSERMHNEASWHAGELIAQGAIGRVLQVIIMAPHNLAKSTRPAWFFDKSKYGGILTDIGSHQFEQFLTYGGAEAQKINFARVENFANPDVPGLEDFGEASVTLANGVSCYCRLDWFNPAGHRSWGDGRAFILGTEGTIEIRKNNDLCREPQEGSVLYLVDGDGEKRIPCAGNIGFPFFGRLILDCLHRTEKAMTQRHVFHAAETSMRAQALADDHR